MSQTGSIHRRADPDKLRLLVFHELIGPGLEDILPSNGRRQSATEAIMSASPRKYRTALSILVVLAIAAGAFVYLRLKPVDVVVAQREREVSIEVFGLGTVEARTISNLGFEVAGTLVVLHGDAGDTVSKGDVLAELLSREQTARVASAKAAAAQARANATQAGATVDRANVALRQKLAISERREELARRGAVSSEISEEARAAFEIAQADLALAESAVEVARENVQQAEALVQVEEARLAKYTLEAPYSGVIVARQRDLGSMLNPGETLYTIADPASIWALAYVDEAKSGQIAVGQPATVTLRSNPSKHIAARVARIDIESDRVNEERRVYVRCDVCPGDFHLGEQTEVRITVATLEDALLVPMAAVREHTDNTGKVWIVAEGRIAEATLTFGQKTLDGRLEVVDGLPDGAALVVEASGGLAVGRSARIAGTASP